MQLNHMLILPLAPSFRFYHLNKEQSLCDNLQHKTVVEFPTLHVVQAAEAVQYEVEQGVLLVYSQCHLY